MRSLMLGALLLSGSAAALDDAAYCAAVGVQQCIYSERLTALCDSDSSCDALDTVWSLIEQGHNVEYAVAQAVADYPYLDEMQVAQLYRNAFKGF